MSCFNWLLNRLSANTPTHTQIHTDKQEVTLICGQSMRLSVKKLHGPVSLLSLSLSHTVTSWLAALRLPCLGRRSIYNPRPPIIYEGAVESCKANKKIDVRINIDAVLTYIRPWNNYIYSHHHPSRQRSTALIHRYLIYAEGGEENQMSADSLPTLSPTQRRRSSSFLPPACSVCFHLTLFFHVSC